MSHFNHIIDENKASGGHLIPILLIIVIGYILIKLSGEGFTYLKWKLGATKKKKKKKKKKKHDSDSESDSNSSSE